MRTTITVRADKPLRAILDRRAAATGKTVSQVVREILEDALIEKPWGLRAGHLKGGLALRDKASDAWRGNLRQRNWRR